MKHIILAAGMGTRLFPLTLSTPKVLLPLGQDTLLSHQIDISLTTHEIDTIEIVTGFLSEMIVQYIQQKWSSNPRITTVVNHNYIINNPIYSLFTSMSVRPDTDLLITNGDVLYSHSVLRQLLHSKEEGITMVVSPYRDHTNRAMTVHVTDGRMVAIYPHAPERSAYESPGIVLIRGEEARSVFYASMQNLYRQYLGLPHYWHDILNDAKRELSIKTHLVQTDEWGEVDVEGDLISLRARGRMGDEI